MGTACGVGHKEFAVIEWLTTKLALLRRANVALWNSLSGAFQLWIGPRRIRHSNPFGGVAGRVVMKPNLLGAAGRVRTQKRPTWFSRQFRRKALKITGGQGNSHWQGNRGR